MSTPRAAAEGPAGATATIRGALDLDRLAVIGLAGAPSSRRALVRLPGGRIRSVAPGDRLRPGRILRIEPEGLILETREGAALLPLAGTE